MGGALAKMGIVGPHFMVYQLYGVSNFIPLVFKVVVI
jgi:hypothetical protein